LRVECASLGALRALLRSEIVQSALRENGVHRETFWKVVSCPCALFLVDHDVVVVPHTSVPNGNGGYNPFGISCGCTVLVPEIFAPPFPIIPSCREYPLALKILHVWG
jgi:hypothetical protein